MGRNKGSLNKPKTTTLKVLSFDRQVEGSPITRNSSQGWVNYGLNNNMPEMLLDLYNQSPTHQSAIKFGVQSIVGEGIDYDAMQVDGTQLVPNYYESWDAVLRHISFDYMLFGSFAIEIIKNKDGKTYSFWHIPLYKVRWGEYDDDGQITEYYICSDWTKVSQIGATKVKAFDMQTEIKQGEPYLFVYRDYTPTMTYYTAPIYQAGLKAIQSEIEAINFDLKSAFNSFVPSGMLVLPQQESEEDKQTIIKEISRMFQGTNNANSLMVTFRNSVEDNQPEFVPFQSNTGNVNLFESADIRARARILSSHQIPDAALCGLPSIGQTGFSSEAAKLETAYKVYNKLVGNYNRNAVVGTINFMLRLNGIDVELVLKPMTFGLEENEQPKKTNEQPQEVDKAQDNEIEEKVEGA